MPPNPRRWRILSRSPSTRKKDRRDSPPLSSRSPAPRLSITPSFIYATPLPGRTDGQDVHQHGNSHTALPSPKSALISMSGLRFRRKLVKIEKRHLRIRMIILVNLQYCRLETRERRASGGE